MCCITAMLLMVDLRFSFDQPATSPVPDFRTPLTIHIKPNEPEPRAAEPVSPQPVPDDSEQVGASADPTEAQSSIGTDLITEPAPTEKSRVDWLATAKNVARSSVEVEHRARELRNKMWRQSFSTMFQPESESMIAEQPVMASLEFKPEFRVLGIGVHIGSCFFGVPILGVPVEQRTVGPNVIVCAQRSK